MSARQRAPERIVSPRLSIPEWIGHLSSTDGIRGQLLCSSTGWRMAVTGTADGKAIIHLTAQFDSPVFGDDAFPGAIEGELAKPHEAQAAGYDCFWTGSIHKTEVGWIGTLGDRYGGRLAVTGKQQGAGVMSLRATARVEEVRG